MKTAHHRFAVAILALLVLPVPAWGAVEDEDPIKAELDAARKVHADAVAAAKAVLLKAFDDEIRKVAAKGDLNWYKALQADKEKPAWEVKLIGTHPLLKQLSSYIEREIETTKQLAAVLEASIKKYTMGLKIEEATAVQNEWKKLLLQLQQKAYAAIRLLGGIGTVSKRPLGDWKVSKMRFTSLSNITDAGLVYLKGLTKLEELSLELRTNVTNDGLAHLRGLTKLKILNLGLTKVTDAGLVHLKGLTKLETLILLGTKVTLAGVKKLQQALPNCKIVH